MNSEGSIKWELNQVFSLYHQGFIQAILMSSRQHKKLDLLTEFYNSIFIKFILKHIGVELSFKIN